MMGNIAAVWYEVCAGQSEYTVYQNQVSLRLDNETWANAARKTPDLLR